MKSLRIALVLPWLLLAAAGMSWAATQYGEAVVEKGAMTIVREGQTLKFDQSNTGVPVNEGDLIRVRRASVVQLKSRENAAITLGSNAVFQVKPWRTKAKSGFMRALFGRFRASIVGLSGGEQFNVKTATATIGVKGTEYRSQVTSRGGTMLIVSDSVVGFQGQTGGEQDVGEGFLSLIVGINPPTPPIPTPPEVQQAFGATSLDAPAANSPESRTFAAQSSLTSTGAVFGGGAGGDGDDGGGGGGGDGDGNEAPVIGPPPNLEPRASVPIQFQ